MKTIPASRARASLGALIDQTARTNETVRITSRRSDAVLISMEHWRAIQETLHLLTKPRMGASIRKGLATPVEDCYETLDW